MDITTARNLAASVFDRPNYNVSTALLWEAHDALDAVLFTADAEPGDIARKGTILGALRRHADSILL